MSSPTEDLCIKVETVKRILWTQRILPSVAKTSFAPAVAATCKLK